MRVLRQYPNRQMKPGASWPSVAPTTRARIRPGKIKNDAAGRGWFSDMGAILAVKAEIGMADKRDAGPGMAPICWLY